MNKLQLISAIKQRKSLLCVGLDSDLDKIPVHLKGYDDPLFEFNRQIIDATRPYCVAYKLNTAFYERLGAAGWHILEKTRQYIGNEHFIIADAKRGDIGNTAHYYAQAFFEKLEMHAITVAPYMGRDSIMPFLSYPEKWAIVLGLTSNEGAADFELQILANGMPVYAHVMQTVAQWASNDQLMFVVGATQVQALAQIRSMLPNHFLLIPGVGAQGGSLHDVMQHGLTAEGGLLINASRSIIYASNDTNFAQAAQREAMVMQHEMQQILASHAILQ